MEVNSGLTVVISKIHPVQYGSINGFLRICSIEEDTGE